MYVLGIESSCDETAVAVVEDGRRIVSSVIASQVDLHRAFGGVVPEVASRQHLRQAVPTLQQALGPLTLDHVDGVAATNGPGLPGSLLVGLNMGKAIAYSRGLPLVGINHLEAHIYANWLEHADLAESPPFPLLCLLVSGGHTDLVLMRGHADYTLLGRTRDDAAGEAFDKVARLLGLGYPGGPAIEKIAREAKSPVPLPRAWLKDSHDFSFSGLKTAVLHAAQARGLMNDHQRDMQAVTDLAAGFQDAVVEVLAGKTAEAAATHNVKLVLLAGGVAANKALRHQLEQRCPVPVRYPRPLLCTDNAAMVAACGFYRLAAGHRDGWDLDVAPDLKLG